MKIKGLGFLTFQIKADDTTVVTDPISLFSVTGFNSKVEADMIITTDPSHIGQEDLIKKEGLESKIVSNKREKVFEIANSGEFEIGGVLVRKQDCGIVIIDSGYTRIVYLGYLHKDIDITKFKGLGDVDVLIIPVGDGEKSATEGSKSTNEFLPTVKVEKIISIVEPSILIPSGYKNPAVKGTESLMSVEDFLKECGYSGAETVSELKVEDKQAEEDKRMKIVVLS